MTDSIASKSICMLFLLTRRSWTSYADTSTIPGTSFRTSMRKLSFERTWNSEVKRSPKFAGRGSGYSIWYWLWQPTRKLTAIPMQPGAWRNRIYTIRGHSDFVKSISCEERASKSVRSILSILNIFSVGRIRTLVDRRSSSAISPFDGAIPAGDTKVR